jgi:hypothetical protein
MFSRDAKSQSQADLSQFEQIARLFDEDAAPLIEKIEAFPKYITRQTMAKFLTKYELFKQILEVNGSIVECGVLHGAGTLAWAKLSSIFEPANHTRKVVGFDTFDGFPSVAAQDTARGTFGDLKVGGLTGSRLENVQETARIYDLNRAIAHIPKIELIKGDIAQTAPKYIEDNPHLVVALLYLDFDLYEPTKLAIETFVPRMPKGSVIVFDELNAEIFPGETSAVLDTLGIRNLRIRRFAFDSYVSYAVLE